MPYLARLGGQFFFFYEREKKRIYLLGRKKNLFSQKDFVEPRKKRSRRRRRRRKIFFFPVDGKRLLFLDATRLFTFLSYSRKFWVFFLLDLQFVTKFKPIFTFLMLPLFIFRHVRNCFSFFSFFFALQHANNRDNDIGSNVHGSMEKNN